MTHELIFVYGTLLPGTNHPMAKWLEVHTTFIGKGKFPGRLFMVKEYPAGCFDESGKSFVYGSILQFRNEDKVLETLDKYEEIGDEFEIPNEFRRSKVKILDEDNKINECWVYLYNRSTENLSQILSGTFLPNI